MKFFLDTNVLVYAIHQESPQHKYANDFILKCLNNNVNCYFLSSSLKDVYYILCRHYLSEDAARQSIKVLRETLDMADLNSTFVDKAFSSDEPDFEDGVVRAAAEMLQVDAIISYDGNAFQASFIPKMTAKEALDAFEVLQD